MKVEKFTDVDFTSMHWGRYRTMLGPCGDHGGQGGDHGGQGGDHVGQGGDHVETTIIK